MTPNMKQDHAPPGMAPQTSLHERDSEDSGPASILGRPHPHFWPTIEQYDPGTDPLVIARTREHTSRIARWEDEPLDPDDDLALIAAYPREVARLRLIQDAIRRHPLYLVAQAAGPELRHAFLAEATSAAGVECNLAEAFFEARLCRCELGREFPDGSAVYRGHRDAATCNACLLRASFERIAHGSVAG